MSFYIKSTYIYIYIYTRGKKEKKKNQPYWSLDVNCQEGGVRNFSLGYIPDFSNMLALVSFLGLPKLLDKEFKKDPHLEMLFSHLFDVALDQNELLKP
jgi:hypothetical protein